MVTFSVLISLVPVGFAYIALLTDSKPANIIEMLSRGELLLITVALAADAIGDLIGRGNVNIRQQLTAAGGCTVSVMFSSFYFAHVHTTAPGNPTIVFYVSMALFLITLVSSGYCKSLT